MYVFVYGSLMRGYGNHGILRDARFVKRATTQPDYVMHDLGAFPALTVAVDNGVAIQGEVYQVDPFTLRQLDILEGVPHLYRRIKISLQDGTNAETYVFARSTNMFRATPIHGGCWDQHCKGADL